MDSFGPDVRELLIEILMCRKSVDQILKKVDPQICEIVIGIISDVEKFVTSSIPFNSVSPQDSVCEKLYCYYMCALAAREKQETEIGSVNEADIKLEYLSL